MDEINEELIQQEMAKLHGGALTALEWFLVFSFIDQAMAKDEMFAKEEDKTALAVVVKRLHEQIFPAPKEETLEDKLKVKPKKLIVNPDIII
jgi:hypothetical protein